MDSQTLYKQIFDNGSIWNVGSELSKVDSTTMSTLFSAGIIVGFVAVCIQMFSALFAVYRDKNTNLMDFIAPMVLKMVLAAAVLNPGTYTFIVNYLFAVPADTVANMITNQYIASFTSKFATVMSAISESPNKISSLISATLDGSLISTLIAGLIFWAAAICCYVTPMIQKILFMFAFYCGPICIGFGLCDYTAEVFKKWVGMMLTICWLGFFGSVSFLVVDTCNLLGHLSTSAGGDKSNVIITMIYGVISIVLFCSAFPISTFFFGSIGELAGGLSNPGRAIGGTASAAVGGAAASGVSAIMLGSLGKAAGSGLSKVAKKGSMLSSLAKSMQNIGGGTLSAGKTVAENSDVRMPPRKNMNSNSSTSNEKSGGKSPNIPESKKDDEKKTVRV